MKSVKSILALALVFVAVFAIAAPALAEVWSARYGDIDLYKNQGNYRHIRNVQSDLNKYFEFLSDYQLDVDGYFGDLTLRTVKEFQRRMGITVDGWVGPQTKGYLWMVFQGEIDPPRQ